MIVHCAKPVMCGPPALSICLKIVHIVTTGQSYKIEICEKPMQIVKGCNKRHEQPVNHFAATYAD